MQQGTVEAGGLARNLFFSPIFSPPKVTFTPDGGGVFPVLRSGIKSRAYYCRQCEIVVFAKADER